MPIAIPAPILCNRVWSGGMNGSKGLLCQFAKPKTATIAKAIMTRMEMTVLTAPTSLMPRILMYVKQTMTDALKRYSSIGVRSMTLATYDPASTT